MASVRPPRPPVRTSIGANDVFAVSPPRDAVDVTAPPYSAVPDGSSDTLPALHQAIADNARTGNTVFLPGDVGTGDYRISDTLSIDADDLPLTIMGDGAATRIVIDGSGYYGIEIGGRNSGRTLSGLTLRDLFVQSTVGEQTDIHGIVYHQTGTTGNDCQLRNLWVDGWRGPDSLGINSDADGASVLEHITVSNAGLHGIGFEQEDPDARGTLRSILAFNNSLSGGGYGIDCEGSLIENAVCVENEGGAKTAPDDSDTTVTTWRNCWFLDNERAGFSVTGDVPAALHLDGCYARGNGWRGFYLPQAISRRLTGHIRAVNNNTTGDRDGNIFIDSPATDLDRVESSDAANGHGLILWNDAAGSIGSYTHRNNADGPIKRDEAASVSIGSDSTGETTIPALPLWEVLVNTGSGFQPASVQSDGGSGMEPSELFLYDGFEFVSVDQA